MGEISLIIRSADRARKAEITVADSQTAADVIQAAIDNWSLPRDVDYSLVNVSKNPPVSLTPSTTLEKAGIAANDTLEIQPVLVAGFMSYE